MDHSQPADQFQIQFHQPWGSWLAARVCNLEVNTAALWAELTALRGGLHRGAEDAEEAKREAAAAKAEAAAAKAEAAELRAEAAAAKAEAAAAKAEAMDLRADARKLETDAKDLEAEARKARAEAKKAAAAVAELERVRADASELEVRFCDSLRGAAEATERAAKLETLLSESAEREEARAVRHEADLAAAMALLDKAIADSEKRVAKTKAFAAKQTKCRAVLDRAIAAMERASAKRPSADSPIERNRSRGFMVCIMALSQGVDDVHAIATAGGRVPSPTMTRDESYALKKTYLFSKRTLAHLRDAVNRFGALTAGDPRVVSFPVKPGAVIKICESVVWNALRTVFDGEALARMNDTLCCVVEAIDVGLDAYGATVRLDDRTVMGFGLADALEAAPKFDGDDDEFQRGVEAWSSALRIVHPWRERAEETRGDLRAAGVPLTKRPVTRLGSSRAN